MPNTVTTEYRQVAQSTSESFPTQTRAPVDFTQTLFLEQEFSRTLLPGADLSSRTPVREPPLLVERLKTEDPVVSSSATISSPGFGAPSGIWGTIVEAEATEDASQDQDAATKHMVNSIVQQLGRVEAQALAAEHAGRLQHELAEALSLDRSRSQEELKEAQRRQFQCDRQVYQLKEDLSGLRELEQERDKLQRMVKVSEMSQQDESYVRSELQIMDEQVHAADQARTEAERTLQVEAALAAQYKADAERARYAADEASHEAAMRDQIARRESQAADQARLAADQARLAAERKVEVHIEQRKEAWSVESHTQQLETDRYRVELQKELEMSQREKRALEQSRAKQEEELDRLRRELEEARRLREEERANKDPWIVAATELPSPTSPVRQEQTAFEQTTFEQTTTVVTETVVETTVEIEDFEIEKTGRERVPRSSPTPTGRPRAPSLPPPAQKRSPSPPAQKRSPPQPRAKTHSPPGTEGSARSKTDSSPGEGSVRPFLKRGGGMGGMDHRRIKGVQKERVKRDSVKDISGSGSRTGSAPKAAAKGGDGTDRSPPRNEVYLVKLLPSRSQSPPPFRDLRRVLPHNLAQCSAVVAI